MEMEELRNFLETADSVATEIIRNNNDCEEFLKLANNFQKSIHAIEEYINRDISYAVNVYKSISDYGDRKIYYCFDGFTKKDLSLKFAKQILDFYPIVKWQSSDREEIEVFTKDGIQV